MPNHLTHFEQLGIASTFAGVCGALSYALDVRQGKAFSWIDLAINILVSAVCGLIAFEILEYEGFLPQLAGALCGMAGFVGTTLVRFVRTFTDVKTEQLIDEIKSDKHV